MLFVPVIEYLGGDAEQGGPASRPGWERGEVGALNARAAEGRRRSAEQKLGKGCGKQAGRRELD